MSAENLTLKRAAYRNRTSILLNVAALIRKDYAVPKALLLSMLEELVDRRGSGPPKMLRESAFGGANCHGCRFLEDGFCHADQETVDTEAIEAWSWNTTFDSFGLPHLDDKQTQAKGCPGFERE